MAQLFIGLMAGTSADGLDCALVDFEPRPPEVVAWHYAPYSDPLRERILAVAAGRGDDLDSCARLDHELGRFFAAAVLELLASNPVAAASSIIAIGSHGQTIRHRAIGSSPYSTQIADANLIAEATGITTVADFRRRDLAAGGQGAPLAPGFHADLFSAPGQARAILNVGGMANLTLLSADGRVRGFDTGPGNVLLDAWHQRHRRHRFDRDGDWAASGQPNADLLARLLEHPFFGQVPPRSCGREEFNLDWLDSVLAQCDGINTADTQATLAELTARSIADGLNQQLADCQQLIVCGGGVHNLDLMRRLQRRLPAIKISSSTDWGVQPDQVEAVAFAWLARQTLAGLAGNQPGVTGARGPRVLGAIHPGAQRLTLPIGR